MSTAAAVADAIEAGRAEHPDWEHIRGMDFRHLDGRQAYAWDADVNGACAWGFARVGMDDLLSDSPSFPGACPAFGEPFTPRDDMAAADCAIGADCRVYIEHLNDGHGWSLDQIVAWLRSIDA